MKAADTNIVVRLIIGDDPAQRQVAERLVIDGVFVPVTVLLETEWVLRSRYRLPRDLIATSLGDLLDAPGIHLTDEPQMRWAIARYAAGADFADMIHLCVSHGRDAFVTFDTDLARAAGSGTPTVVETLRG